MTASPYLCRPVRTYAEARADIERAQRPALCNDGMAEQFDWPKAILCRICGERGTREMLIANCTKEHCVMVNHE